MKLVIMRRMRPYENQLKTELEETTDFNGVYAGYYDNTQGV